MGRAARAMRDWFCDFEESLWLKGDEGSEAEAAFVLRALRLGPGSRVLDAACGAGRIAVHLAKSGCVVTGVDVNAKFVARARTRFRTEGLKGSFSVLDMREMRFRDRFDGACNWGGSFGYFSDEENLEVLRRMAGALRHGGRLLIDQVNRQYVLRHFRSESVEPALTIRTRWNTGLQRIVSRWTVTRSGRRRHCRSTIRLYTPSQFKRLLQQAGLAWETAYGGPDGSEYRPSSRRLIVVGRKLS